MHWPFFGASGKPTDLCAWADHPGEKLPPGKQSFPRCISSTCEPRSSPRPDPAYSATTDGFLEKLPGEGGNDDGRNHLEHFEGKVYPLLRAWCGEHDDRVVPQVDAIRAHTEPAKRAPANSHA